MLKKFCLLCGFLLTFTLPAISQATSETTCTIKGEVIDSITGETIPYCTVSAFNAKTPAVCLKRIPTDGTGKFSITLKANDTILIKFESLGMKSIQRTVSLLENKTINLGKISLPVNDKILSEVTVTAAKPLVKVDIDKIIYDTKSDPESATSNTLEILRKVPMITVDEDENIKVKGKSNFKIFMNGKPSNLITNNPSEVLKSIPAGTIKNIEVITEPGVKYEAEGLAGIINIVTERALVGYTATVRASVDNYGGGSGGIYFSTKIKKFGISTNLNKGIYRNPGYESTGHRTNLTDFSNYKYLNQHTEGKSNNNNQNGYMDLSYEIDSLNLISVSASTFSGKNSSNMDLKTAMLSNSLDTIQSYTQHNKTSGMWGGYNANFDYQRSFMKPDKLFTFSYHLDYSPGNNESDMNLTGIRNYENRHQKIESQSLSTEHTFQVDYTEPFNKKHILEIGAKYIFRNNGSETDYQTFDKTAQTWIPTPNMKDNDLQYNQGILGAYGSYTLKMKKYSLRAGWRLEHTSSTVDFKNNPEQNFDVPSFTNLVPSLNFTYRLNEKNNFRLSYNQRLSRPGIWYLNPYVNSTNPEYVSQGNPNLKTEVSNSFDLNYGFVSPKFNINISTYTSFTNNSIENITELRDSIVFSTYKNIGVSQNSGLSTYFSWQTNSNLSFYSNASLNYSRMSDRSGETGLERSGFNYQIYLGGNYNLPKDFRLGWNGSYNSPYISLQSKGSPFYYYGLNLTKSMFKHKLNITLNANSFIEKNRTYKSHTETATFRNENTSIYPARRIGISVSYTFGQMKEQIKKAQRSISNNDVKTGGRE